MKSVYINQVQQLTIKTNYFLSEFEHILHESVLIHF